MVHNNYKWNISKKAGIKLVDETINDILAENKEDRINYEELTFALNNRTKDKTIKNNNKKKNINNFIKNVLGGLIFHIQSGDNFEIINSNDGKIYIKLLSGSEIIYNDWVFVDDSDSDIDD